MSIKDVAVATEERNVFLPYNEVEHAQMKDNAIQQIIDLDAVTEEFALIKKEYAERIKHAKELLSSSVYAVKTRGRNVKATCYLVDDQDAGVMQYLLEDGTIVHSRPLYPNERQLRLATGGL